MLLNEAIAAVVVGDEQAIGGDEFAGAAAAKQHNAVFHAVMINTVNVVGSQFKAHFLHLRFIIIEEERDPHTFIGVRETLH